MLWSRGLKGLWRFENTALDGSGNGNNGTLQGTPPSYAAAKFGQGISLNGTSDYISVAHSTSLTLSNLTIAAWMRQTTPNVTFTLVSKTQPASPWHGFRFGSGSAADGKPRLWINETDVVATTRVDDNTFHHVAVTYISSSRAYAFYLDGKLNGAGTHSSGPLINSGEELRIGRENAVTRYFKGILDEVSVWNRALTESDIRRAMLGMQPLG